MHTTRIAHSTQAVTSLPGTKDESSRYSLGSMVCHRHGNYLVRYLGLWWVPVTKDSERIKDWRSTGRRRGRNILYRAYVSYECIECGVTSNEPPKDAPSWFADIWPVEEKARQGQTIDSQLQVDHETKDLQDEFEDNLNWRCPTHHKLHDLLSERGESTKQTGGDYDFLL